MYIVCCVLFVKVVYKILMLSFSLGHSVVTRRLFRNQLKIHFFSVWCLIYIDDVDDCV